MEQRRAARRAAAWVAAALAIAAQPAAGRAAQPSIQLTVDTPADGLVVGDALGAAFIAGKVLAYRGSAERVDLVIALDQSESTGRSAGTDVDGDGRTEGDCKRAGPAPRWWVRLLGRCEPTGDSVLAAELAAVRTLLEELDARVTRVGLVTFSGDGQSETPDASVAVPLSSDYAEVRRALGRIQDQGPLEWTNLAAGIRAAADAFAASPAAPGAAARRVMWVVSDGVPRTPQDASSRHPVPLGALQRGGPRGGTLRSGRSALEAARAVSSLGIQIDTFALGPRPDPDAVLRQVAQLAQGAFHPVARLSELPSAFQSEDLARVDVLEIRNLTHAAQPQYGPRGADGSFSALLALGEGPNLIELYAHSRDGASARVQRTLTLVREGEPAPLEPALRAARNHLLETQLGELHERTLQIQAARDERVRQDLEGRLARGRAAARERARALRIEAPRELQPDRQ